MNRVLYQLSYAAICKSPTIAENQLCYYIQGLPFRQELFAYFPGNFWESYHRGGYFGNFTAFFPVFAGWQWVLRPGMALAWAKPHQYVLCRGCVFSAVGMAENDLSPIKTAPTGHRRGVYDHNG